MKWAAAAEQQLVTNTLPGLMSGLADVTDGTNVGVAQGRDSARFAFEAPTQPGIRCQMRQENFDGDHPIQPGVERAIHRSHSACAEQSLQFVSAEVSAGFEVMARERVGYSRRRAEQQV
jgi:hypothetical protein